MATVYTHTFIFQAGDKDIQGKLEFNIDGEASYKTNNPIEDLKLQEALLITELFNNLKRIFDKFGGITKIEIEKE